MQITRRGILLGAGAAGGLIAAWALTKRNFAPPLVPGEGEFAFDAWLKIGKDGVVSVAVADLDADGRVDLALGQNSGPTLVFRNRAARPGLRVRLKGPPGNPTGIGASLRWWAAGKAGPRREVRMGGGYCSVDSPVTSSTWRATVAPSSTFSKRTRPQPLFL